MGRRGVNPIPEGRGLQRCCDRIVKKLEDSLHSCSSCGKKIGRDHNSLCRSAIRTSPEAGIEAVNYQRADPLILPSVHPPFYSGTLLVHPLP